MVANKSPNSSSLFRGHYKDYILMTFKVKTQEGKLQQNNKTCLIPIYCYYNENIKV